MPPSWHTVDFPKLIAGAFTATSPVTNRYNCIAWAAGDDQKWWWPDQQFTEYWPVDVPREETLEAFIAAYGTLGYEKCADGTFESGFEKVALYGVRGAGGSEPTHAARQLPDGGWTSKLGGLEDIRHDQPEAVNGPLYSQVIQYLKRSIP